MLSKKSRHMSSLANFGSRRLIVPAPKRRFGMTLVISGSSLDEAIAVGIHKKKAPKPIRYLGAK